MSGPLRRGAVRGLLAVSLLAGAGCNHYEWFRVIDDRQLKFTNDADILFVVDNSTSMYEDSAALAFNMDGFIRRLVDPTEGGTGTDGLPDAVRAYIDFVQRRGTTIDFQIGVTTTNIGAHGGDLVGDPQIIENSYDGDIASTFNRNLLCEATCFGDRSALPSDPDFTCDPETPAPGDAISAEYMDCLCGGSDWVGNCPSGEEEALEAVFQTMCRAAEEPPDACFGDRHLMPPEAAHSLDGFLRPGGTLVAVIVTDEGDTSTNRGASSGESAQLWLDLYEQFDQRLTFAAIAPDLELCPDDKVTDWAVGRLEEVVDVTDGVYAPLVTPEGGCSTGDFASALSQIGDLINRPRTVFELEGVPDVDTIRCFVDDEKVDRAVESDDGEGGVSYGDGWSYDPVRNAVRFHGAAVPDYDTSVEIYYRPVQGMPRDLPF